MSSSTSELRRLPPMLALADLSPAAWLLIWARRVQTRHDVWASRAAPRLLDAAHNDLSPASLDPRDPRLAAAYPCWELAEAEMPDGQTEEIFWLRVMMALDLVELLGTQDAREAGLAESDLTALGWTPAQVRRHVAAALGLGMEALGLPEAAPGVVHQRQWSDFAAPVAAACAALCAGPLALALIAVATLI